MKNILMLATGGTIACEPSEDGLVPRLSGEAMLRHLGRDLPCRADVRELMNLDSSNLQPEDWETMAAPWPTTTTSTTVSSSRTARTRWPTRRRRCIRC